MANAPLAAAEAGGTSAAPREKRPPCPGKRPARMEMSSMEATGMGGPRAHEQCPGGLRTEF